MYVYTHPALQNIKIITQQSNKTYPCSEQLAVAHVANALHFLVKIICNIISVCCLYLGQSLTTQIKTATYCT